MGKVNVVLPDGGVVSVDEETARAAQGDNVRMESAGEAGSRTEAEAKHERFGGTANALAEVGISALDTATFGAAGKIAAGIGGSWVSDYQQGLAEEHPTAGFVGELASMVAPTGLLGDAAKGASEFSAVGLASKAGEAVGGGVVGRAVEGGLFGAGGYVAGTNATGDPLSIEAAVESAGFGALFNVGVGKLADSIEGRTWNAKLGVAKRGIEAESERGAVEAANKGAEAFKDTPPSYNEFREAHEAQQSAISKFNAGVEKEARAYEEFWQSNKKLGNAIEDAQKLVSSSRNEAYASAQIPRENLKFVDGKWRAELTPAGAGTAEGPKTFADEVNAAARKAEKFGDRKSFVSSIYDQIKVDHPELSLEDFKGKLLAEQKVGALKMSRADLVAAMDPKLVAASEVNHPAGAQFHFVEAPPEVPAAAADRRLLKPVQPPISDNLAAKYKEYNERISAIIKKKAGGNRIDGGRWVKDPSIAPDPRGAMEDLRALQDQLMSGNEGGMPHRSRALTELPPIPREPKPLVEVTVPRTLRDFSRLHADTVNKLATGLDPASPAAEAFGRLTDDLGLARSATPGATIADVHGTLREYNAKLTELSKKAAAKEAEDAQKPWWLRLANKGAKYAAARAFDHVAGGGMPGAFARVIGGEATGGLMGKAEDATMGAMLVSSKATLRSRLQGLVAKYGVPTASLTHKLGPVTAYLSQSFPSGKKDPETDPRKLAVNRTNEIMAHTMSAPDTAFMAVQNMMGHPSDAAFKIHQRLVGTLQHLASTLPRDPGTDTKMFGSNWTPQWQQAMELAHRLEAIQDPLTSIARALSGGGHPSAAETLWTAYPNVMNELSQEIAFAAPQMKGLTYEQTSAYSQLFRKPMSGLQEPSVVLAIQGLYLPKSQASGGAQGGAAGPSKPTGRPAAVQSSVAGSSPALLTSQ